MLALSLPKGSSFLVMSINVELGTIVVVWLVQAFLRLITVAVS